MKVTLEEAVKVEQALTSLAERRLPIKQAYWLAKLLLAVQAETKLFMEKRMELIKLHGQPVEGSTTGEYRIAPERQQKFTQEIMDLGSIEVELKKDKLIFDLPDDFQIEPKLLAALAAVADIKENA